MEKSDYCRKFIETLPAFSWIIDKIEGPKKVLELLDYARENKEDILKKEINSIWRALPSDVFNIRTNPKGYEAFLSFVEE